MPKHKTKTYVIKTLDYPTKNEKQMKEKEKGQMKLIPYKKLRAKHQKMFDDFPQFAAFSSDQLEAGKKKLGVEAKEITNVGMGVFVRKTDVEALKKVINDNSAEMQESLKDKDFLFGAILYELANHEYGITFDASETLECLNIVLREENQAVFDAAVKEYMAGFDF